MQLIREINDNFEIKNPKDCLKYLKEFKNEDREYIIVLGLDNRNNVMYRDIAHIGTLDSCIMHPREIFKNAILKSASRIIVAHNHPSNSDTPSDEDIIHHKRLVTGGDLLDIDVIDCLIITDNGVKSFMDDLK